MTALTMKQRAKVNAALCLIHDSGGDASAVSTLARNIMGTGHDARTAYEKAINSFAAQNPEVGQAIGKMTKLVEASNAATVAQYDHALSQYISTGNNSALTALAPTIAADSMALAIHNGEITKDEAAEGGVAKALGFTPGPLLTAPAPAAQPAPMSRVTDTIGFAETPAAVARSTDAQVSFVAGPGMVAPKAQKAQPHYSGFVRDAPVSHGLTISGAREAARAAASRGSVAIVEDAAQAG